MKSTESHYHKLKNIVYNECGINLHEGKDKLLKARVARRMRLSKTDSITNYVKLIKKDENEFLNFIDAVSTNHTFFFRENHHCKFITDTIDPATPLRIWSAAASSGEEAYSIAVQLLAGGYRFHILASDLSTHVLKMAKRGIYGTNKAANIPTRILHQYFQKGLGNWNGHIRVKKEVQDHISFQRINLVTEPPPGRFDIIFCRNIMIYFDTETKQRVINKLYHALNPGGYFIIGAAEGLVGLKHNFKYIKPSIYRK